MSLSAQFETVLQSIILHKEEFVISTPSLESFTDAEVKLYLQFCVYFSVNGPVGLNKTTKYPFLQSEKSVRSFFGQRVSKKNFLETCGLIKEILSRSVSKDESIMLSDFGELWPCERFEAKTK